MKIQNILIDNEKKLRSHFTKYEQSIQQTINKINALDKEGDIYKYILASSSSKDKIAQYDIYHSAGFKSSLDIIKENSINKFNVTYIDDLKIGHTYNTTLISAIANNFNILKGMYYVDDGLGKNFVVVKATINGSIYPNKWIIKDKKFIYYMEKETELFRELLDFRHKPNFELYSRFIVGQTIDLHLFTREYSNSDFIYKGIYLVNNIVDNNKAFELINSKTITVQDVINEDRNYTDLVERNNHLVITDVYIKGIVNQRTKQGLFRQLQLNHKQHKCEICDIREKDFLIASHIKPYSNSSEDLFSAFDIENGLLLCPNHDHLFDKGYISFDDDGKILISTKLNKDAFELFGLSLNIKIKVDKRKAVYLKYHRDFIFKL